MMQSGFLCVGVDGGGSACRSAARADRALAPRCLTAGPANVTSDFDGALATIATLIEETARGDRVGAIHLGLAGVTGPGIGARVVAALADRFPDARIEATGDQVTTLVGALGARDGAVAAIGTGSFVIRQAGGTVRHVGGRGLVLGDQASGGWLGLRLMQEVMLAHDGLRTSCNLSNAISERHDHDPASMIAFARTARPADFAALAPDILAAASTGDALACALMQEGAAYLVRALAAVGFGDDEPLCLTGGLGTAYGAWLPPGIAARLAPAAGSALDGALHLAERGGA